MLSVEHRSCLSAGGDSPTLPTDTRAPIAEWTSQGTQDVMLGMAVPVTLTPERRHLSAGSCRALTSLLPAFLVRYLRCIGRTMWCEVVLLAADETAGDDWETLEMTAGDQHGIDFDPLRLHWTTTSLGDISKGDFTIDQGVRHRPILTRGGLLPTPGTTSRPLGLSTALGCMHGRTKWLR